MGKRVREPIEEREGRKTEEEGEGKVERMDEVKRQRN